jgi:hypothetical protein
VIERPRLDPEERMFTLSDVKRLYIAKRRQLFKWAVMGALLTFLFLGIRPTKYKVEATFREATEDSGSGGSLKELLGGIGSGQQSQAASYMKSFRVLKPLVSKLGLQVSPGKSGWIVKKIFKRYSDKLKATKGLGLEDLDRFRFCNVVYEGEQRINFGIRFVDKEHFTVHSADQKKEFCQGVVGASVNLEELQCEFTLVKPAQSMKVGVFYPFFVTYWKDVANGLKNDLQISSDKANKSICDLAFFSRDRHLGQWILNEVMSQYQLYLKREHDELAQDQLVYLENKQTQLCGKLEALFQENIDYLAQNVEKNGCISVEQEGQNLLIPYQQMHEKLFATDMELARLDLHEKGGKSRVVTEGGPFSSVINQVAQQMQDLKQQKDLLELSLCQFSEQSLTMRRDDLKEIRNQRLAVEKLIHEIDLGEEISSCDLDQSLCVWAASLQDLEEREDFAEYLENYARILSVREKLLQERFFCGNSESTEFDGIDLNTARALFIQYNNKLDTAEAAMRYLTQFKKELHQPDFELSSLSSVLQDALSQKLIAEASTASLQLKDEKYHSSKEGQRYEEQIALQRKILGDHLDQLYKVEELNASLVREKIVGLQKVSLDCINQQISVLHEQASDSIKERKKALLQEKGILAGKMGEIRSMAASLPEKWRLEKWLELKTIMMTKIMQTVTEVVEAKTISHHLHHVESKPLDHAVLPVAPENPRLFLLTLLGALSSAFALFSLCLIRQILKGFPTTLEKLRALRFPALGSISAFCDGPSVETPTGPDLEILRQLALFTEGGKVIGLLAGQGPDYSFALSENLARMSTKSIILRCDFLSKFRKEDCPGLLQIWKGEIGDLPIRKGKGFDYITAGGYSPFGTEIIQSQRFTELLEILKKNYDQIFLLLRTPLTSAESAAALRLCDKVAVTVTKEQTEELTPFITWGYHEDCCRLTFVMHA